MLSGKSRATLHDLPDIQKIKFLQNSFENRKIGI